MKHIPMPDLSGADILKPADMNKILFGGNHTPITPEQIRALGDEQNAPRQRRQTKKGFIKKKK